ncbi:MAG TPA: nucleotidyltransferase domain-containing protein [Vicinamibacterales bacterium]|nr:nucleotidyltransferase domain-containing protein [Vicinamibacterales bacterium]
MLFGSTRRRVLAWLLGHPDEAYYLRQIARQTGAAVGAVQRELKLLTAAGLVRRTVQGRQVYFQADREAPIFPELRGLFAKTAGLVDILRDALAPLGDRIQVAFVFGSAARNELRAASDIDLRVVGDAPFLDVVQAIAAAKEQLGRDINPTVYPPHEFEAKLATHHHFLTTVLQGPRLFVVGGNDELAGLGAERLVEEASEQPKRDSRTARGRRARPRRQRR